MRLHVLTAVTRPQNLVRIAASLVAAHVPEVEVVWHWRFDPDRTAIGGQRLKNEMLDRIQEGWVHVLDDDTVMHPDLLKVLVEFAESRALVVSQDRGDRLLTAARENLHVGSVDIGQAIIRRSLIGALRIPEVYDGDGLFLQELLVDTPDVVFVDEVLSAHNALERVAA